MSASVRAPTTPNVTSHSSSAVHNTATGLSPEQEKNIKDMDQLLIGMKLKLQTLVAKMPQHLDTDKKVDQKKVQEHYGLITRLCKGLGKELKNFFHRLGHAFRSL